MKFKNEEKYQTLTRKKPFILCHLAVNSVPTMYVVCHSTFTTKPLINVYKFDHNQ